MFSRFDSTSRATPESGTALPTKQNRNESLVQPLAQLSSTTAQILNLPISQNWHLPSNWNWRGNSKESKDAILKEEGDFPGKEWSPSSGSTVLGHSNATVTRVVCQGKVLARKTEKIDKRKGAAHLEEMRILQKLDHQHIVQLCGTYSVGDVYNCLIYPVAEMDLTTYMHAGRRINSPNWVRTLSCGLGCLSNALAYIHANGIKHKDIKPANILVLGDVMIFADFGSARAVKDSTGSSGSKSYGPNGMTWMYMPPEVLNGQAHGRSADVFSLGLVFGEMIDYILYPGSPSAVERRLQVSKKNEQKPSWYQPRPMTEDDEDFLEYLPRKKGEMIGKEEIRMLFKVMTAREPERRPSACDVWVYLRGRSFDVNVGELGFSPETCGKCCL